MWISVITHTAVKKNRYAHIDGILHKDGQMLKHSA
jgi:hypothetical protein